MYINQFLTEQQLADLARNDGNRTGLFGNQHYTVTVRQADGKCFTSNNIFVSDTCAEICNNGQDDDQDGAIDENDSDCNCPSGLTNLALGKSATQSSTSSGGGPSRAIDGNNNGVYTGGSVTHTGTSANEWWQVDLGAVQEIKNITLWNRTDNCCSHRLSDFYVFVSDTPFSSNNPATTAGQGTVWSEFITSLNGDFITVAPFRTGRYVRVQQTTNNALSLAEVEVLGCLAVENCTDGMDTVSYTHLTLPTILLV